MLDTPRVLILPRCLARDVLSCLTTLRKRACEEAAAPGTVADEARRLISVRIAAAYVEQERDRGGTRETPVPLWIGLLAALEICVLEWDDPRRKTASRALQRKVAERDGCRCTMPGCTCRRGLQVNHVDERGQGGCNETWNCHAVCAPHHLQGIHGGRASVRGRAPLGIVWRIGRPQLAQWFQNERRIPPERELELEELELEQA
jgi:hypothetical protein